MNEKTKEIEEDIKMNTLYPLFSTLSQANITKEKLMIDLRSNIVESKQHNTDKYTSESFYKHICKLTI